MVVPHPFLLVFFSAIEPRVDKDVASLLVQQEVTHELYGAVGCSLMHMLSPSPPHTHRSRTYNIDTYAPLPFVPLARPACSSLPSYSSAKASYAYTALDDIRKQEEKTNVYGVVCSFTHRHQSRGKDLTNSVSLLDESCSGGLDSAVPCNFFSSTLKGLPAPLMVGDIVRLHRAKVQRVRLLHNA